MPPATKANGHDDYVTPTSIKRLASEIQLQGNRLTAHVEDYSKDRQTMVKTLEDLKDGLIDLTESVQHVTKTVNGYEQTIITIRSFIWKALGAIIIASITGAAGIVGSTWMLSHSTPKAATPPPEYIVQQEQRDKLIMKRLEELSVKTPKKN